ncbi:hypothetical protein BC629DRAFT_1444031 [Irpex lacteus]|nr:hypothetical protein BC629DRAFT_1444031 [Irpex lacteus]
MPTPTVLYPHKPCWPLDAFDTPSSFALGHHSILPLYRLVVAQASAVDANQKEPEETKAEVQRKEVELDQALQDRDSRDRVERGRDLQAQLSSISNSTSASSHEVEVLKQHVEDTERDRRDLIGLISRLKEDATQREACMTSSFKVESLSQQLNLAQTEAQQASSELAAKTDEFANYRRAKHAELTKLQADHDSLDQRFSALESSHKALETSYNSQSHQLTQALTRIQDLTGQLAEQKATYSSEAAGLKRLVEMMEDHEAQAKAIVENIEKEWADVGERAERREAALKDEIETQRARGEEAEKGEFPIPVSSSASMPSTPARGFGTPSVNGTPDFLTQGMLGLSPTVTMASRAQRGGSRRFWLKSRNATQPPILTQQCQEYERMQSEATLLANQLAQAIAERDSHAAAAQQNGQKLAKSTRENELLTRQLDDLTLPELGRQQDPAIPSDEELEDDPNTVPPDNIDAVIANSLQQNQRVLKIARELGKKMEDEVKDYCERLEAEQQVALQEAYSAVKELQDQLENHKKSSELTIQAYAKERDALKRASVVRDEEMALETDTAKEPAEIEAQFETYKTEMGVDSSRLREDLIAMRQATNMQSRDLENLQRRTKELHDQNTQLNRVSEDLLTTTSQNDQLRNKTANLCVEKKIWEAVQARVVEENKTLSVERSQLSDLITNVQRMHHDMEQSGENDRRRLESQIAMLENQTYVFQMLSETSYSTERGTRVARHSTLSQDLELKELRTRIDKMNEEYAKTHEALAVAETNKKHLNEKVEQLTRQLQGNKGKLAVYERCATGAQGAAQRMDEDLTHSQQLEAEVAELRLLRSAEVDLAAARSHMQQFQEISQANEAALAALNSTHDDEYTALCSQLELTQQELAQLTQTHSELKETLTNEQAAWAQDKKTLEETIIDITTSEQSSESDHASRENEVEELEERAKDWLNDSTMNGFTVPDGLICTRDCLVIPFV